MGLLESITQRIKASDLMGALATEFYPEMLAGFLTQFFSGMTARDFYHKLKEIEGRGLLDYLDDGARARLMALTPENLDWLNLEWLVKVIYEEHRGIVNLILSSEYVRNRIERQIELFKEECGR